MGSPYARQALASFSLLFPDCRTREDVPSVKRVRLPFFMRTDSDEPLSDGVDSDESASDGVCCSIAILRVPCHICELPGRIGMGWMPRRRADGVAQALPSHRRLLSPVLCPPALCMMGVPQWFLWGLCSGCAQAGPSARSCGRRCFGSSILHHCVQSPVACAAPPAVRG